jgi:transcriptional regulator with GAF, ATPase, and Fis domain
VSEIANDVLPHDWLGLVFHDHSDRVTLQARSADSFPELRRFAVVGGREYQIVHDIDKERVRIVRMDPPDLIDGILAERYRSFLKVRSVAGEQVMGLSFLSKRRDDVLKKATQVTATETTALLQGESGTAKEVVARR